MTMDASDRRTRPAYARWLTDSNDITQQFLAAGGRPDVVSLAGGLPAAELYPLAAIEAAAGVNAGVKMHRLAGVKMHHG
jgi:2-aminoadipate transaminase